MSTSRRTGLNYDFGRIFATPRSSIYQSLHEFSEQIAYARQLALKFAHGPLIEQYIFIHMKMNLFFIIILKLTYSEYNTNIFIYYLEKIVRMGPYLIALLVFFKYATIMKI